MTLPQAIEVRSIDLSEDEVLSLQAKLDQSNNGETPEIEQRADKRHVCFSYAILAFTHGQDEEQSVMIPLCNMSQNGIAFLFDKRIGEGTTCAVRILLAAGSTLDLQGEVIRCREAGNEAFEVGLKLDQQIHVCAGRRLSRDSS